MCRTNLVSQAAAGAQAPREAGALLSAAAAPGLCLRLTFLSGRTQWKCQTLTAQLDGGAPRPLPWVLPHYPDPCLPQQRTAALLSPLVI